MFPVWGIGCAAPPADKMQITERLKGLGPGRSQETEKEDYNGTEYLKDFRELV